MRDGGQDGVGVPIEEAPEREFCRQRFGSDGESHRSLWQRRGFERTEAHPNGRGLARGEDRASLDIQVNRTVLVRGVGGVGWRR